MAASAPMDTEPTQSLGQQLDLSSDQSDSRRDLPSDGNLVPPTELQYKLQATLNSQTHSLVLSHIQNTEVLSESVSRGQAGVTLLLFFLGSALTFVDARAVMPIAQQHMSETGADLAIWGLKAKFCEGALHHGSICDSKDIIYRLLII
ncbi:hypothetical protein WMY93_016037 [Mugilogobius chulae]|uniref:Uncharacterized protein n=1 Tax=Mugilogobius chulae TaxID=88201 RepID=A0AAW0P314_9GOBI